MNLRRCSAWAMVACFLSLAMPLPAPAATPAAASAGWVQLGVQAASTGPQARLNTAAAWDSQSNRLLVFGGSFTPGGGGDRHNDLWAYQASTGSWSNLALDGAAGSPPGRTNHTVTWDKQNNRLLVFGGYESSPSNDLWAYQQISAGQWSWQQLTPNGAPGSPGGRQWHAATWDTVSNRLLVFGGCVYSSYDCYNDLWAYAQINGAWQWKQLSLNMPGAAGYPAAAQIPGAAWDSQNNRLLVFGGFSFGALTNALWQWTDASGWQQLTAPNPPQPRDPDGFVWDSATSSLLVFGGCTYGPLGNDVWRYTDGGGWVPISQQGSAPAPAGRCIGGVDGDGQGNLFVFGGMLAGGATSNDLWELDTVGPSTTANVNPAPNSHGWNNTNLTVSLNAADNPNGPGIGTLTYSATGAQPIPSTTVRGSSASIPISTEGITTLGYYAADNAGLAESPKTLAVKVDKTPPTVTYQGQSPAPNANGWNKSPVTLTWSCTDTLSGPMAQTTAATMSTEGANQSVIGTCMDLAGNTSSDSRGSINIDLTRPTVVFTGNAGSYTVDQMVNITCTTTDPLSNGAASGIDSSKTTCPNTSSAAYMFKVGNVNGSDGANTIAATAADLAGNVTTAAARFTVTVDAGSLCKLTVAFIQSSPQYPSPDPTTQQMINQAVNAACGRLQSAVSALTATQKASFISLYQQAVAALAAQAWLTQNQAGILTNLSNGI